MTKANIFDGQTVISEWPFLTNKLAIILVILLVKKGYGLVSARSQLYHTRMEAQCDTAG